MIDNKKPVNIGIILSIISYLLISIIYSAHGYINGLGNKTGGNLLLSSDWNSVISNLDELKNYPAISSGTISPFNLTNCPTGWSEYIPARGRFIRGIDNGAGNDPDCSSRVGGCVVGSTQGDEIKSHNHAIKNRAIYVMGSSAENMSQNGSYTLGAATENEGGSETRPKNVALIYCKKN